MMSAFVSLRPISAKRTEVSGSVLGAQSQAVAPHGQSRRWPIGSGRARIGWTASQKGQRAVMIRGTLSTFNPGFHGWIVRRSDFQQGLVREQFVNYAEVIFYAKHLHQSNIKPGSGAIPCYVR